MRSPLVAWRATACGFFSHGARGNATPLEQALEPRGTQRLELGGLSLGGTRRLLLERLGLSLSRQVMRRIYDTTLGNPLFALEVGRTLVADGVPSIGAELPVPERVEELLGTRIAALPDAPRAVLTMVALSPDLRLGQLTALGGEGALAAAVEAGVLVVDGDHVRASHPLVAAAAAREYPVAERRGLHRRIAEVVADGELRTRHLALAAEEPDAALAATVSAAAAAAARRGGAQAAAELADHALRLTPPDDPARVDRLLELGSYLEVAGEKQRLSDLLTPVVDSLAPGPRAPAPGSCSPAAPSRATARSSTSSSARWPRAQTIRGCGRRCWASSPPTWLPSVSSGSG